MGKFVRIKTVDMGNLGKVKFLEIGHEHDADDFDDNDERAPVPDYLCYATFQVVGDDLVPEDWSAYFGVDSTFSVQRGCRMFPHKGEDSLLATIGVWNLSARGYVISDDLEPHVRELLSVLRLPRKDFRDRLKACGLKAYIRIYWRNDIGDRFPFLSEPVSSAMAADGIELEIDEYPQTINVEDEDGVWHQAWA